jgi:hypothetical protein
MLQVARAQGIRFSEAVRRTLVPESQRRGLFRRKSAGRTLRDKIEYLG